MTGIGNVSSTSNTQNVNTIETNSKTNQPTKEYSYGFRARLKSIGRYLTCGFSSTKRREIVIKEFTNTSILDISKLKNRSAEVKTVLLTSNNLSNQQKLELYAQNRKAIDSYCQTAGIKNPLLRNPSFNDLEKITAQGIYTANFPTASNIEIFMNALDAYVNKEFSAIDQSNNLDEKKTKVQKLQTDLKQMITILNQLGLNNEYSKFKNLSHLPIEKQHEKILESFFKQAIFNQKVSRMAMPMQGWLNLVNKSDAKPEEINGAWNEIKKQIDLSDQKLVFKNINTLDNFKDTLQHSDLQVIMLFSHMTYNNK